MSKRGRGPVAVSALLSRITDPALRKRGFASAAVINRWADIVGAALAADTAPQKLSFPRGRSAGGTLHIRAAGASATELQHLEPVLIERINTFFGYRAVARLALVQGPLPPVADRPRRPLRAALDDAEERLVADRVATIEDDSLRGALAGLGRAVMAADKAAKEEKTG